MIGKATLTKRAAAAVKSNSASAAELDAIHREVGQRIREVETLIKAKQAEIETCMSEGDLELLRGVRLALEDLKDESTLLHRQQSELHTARKQALGAEAVRDEAKHARTLEKALRQAEKANAMIAEAEQMARDVIRARDSAKAVGSDLAFDKEVIKALAAEILPEGDKRKQLMIDLGAARAVRYVA